MTKISSAYRLQKHLGVAILIGMVMAGIGISAIYAQEPASVLDYVAWSPDGRILAVSGSYGIRLYNDVLQNLPPLEKATKPSVSVAWSFDGTRLASANFDGSIQIWDVTKAKLIKTWQAHSTSLTKVTWSPDGTRLASSSVDKTAKVWTINTATVLFTLTHLDAVIDVKWSWDSAKLVTASSADESGIAQVWDANTGELLLKIEDSYRLTGIRTIAWHPDNKRLLIVGGIPYIFDTTSTTEPISALCSTGSTIDGTWNADGSRLVLTGTSSVGSIICVAKSDELISMPIFNFRYVDVTSIDWSRADNKIAAVTQNGTLHVIDAVSGTQLSKALTSNASFSNTVNLLSLCVVPQSDLDTLLRKQITEGDVSAFINTVNMEAGTDIDPECVEILSNFSDNFTPTPTNLAAKVSARVTDKGLYNSLSVKLSQQNYTPFINEVKAQRGNKIETQCADEMIEMANSLLNQPTPTPTLKK